MRGLAAVVRDELAQATRTRGLPASFGAALVDGFVAGYDDMRLNPAGTLSFVLHEVEYGRDFLVAVTTAVVEHELAGAAADRVPNTCRGRS